MRPTIALLVPLLFLGCAAEEPPAGAPSESATAPIPPPPTVDEARTLIAESQAFGDYQFSTGASFSIPMDSTRFNEPARTGARDLEKGGWIRVRGGRVELTPKAAGDKRFLVRPNDFLDIVPLARKELLEIQQIRATPEGAAVELTWRWIPNEVGESFTEGVVKERFEATHAATASLQDLGSGWEVMLIERLAEEAAEN